MPQTPLEAERADLKRKREELLKDLRDVDEKLSVADKVLVTKLEKEIDALLDQLPANDVVRYYKKSGRKEINRVSCLGAPLFEVEEWP